MQAAKNENEDTSKTVSFRAHVLPFGVFLGFLFLNSLIEKFALDYATANDIALPFWLLDPKYWVFPLQTVVCGVILLHYRRRYQFSGLGMPVLATLIGVVVLMIWISPQAVFGVARREEGFDPTIFSEQPGWMAFTVFFRFLRLVVVVPFLEEIFWRGFLLRYLVRSDFQTVPFGTFTWLSFGAVALLFAFVHSFADFPAAITTGILYNALAVRSRSLGACVWAHAITNLLLGIYILRTEQWGFW